MKVARNCQQCGIKFETYPSHIKNGGGKFCSRSCLGASKTAATLANRPVLAQPSDHRLIPLSNGKVTKVSIEDFDELSSMSWQISNSGYVHRRGEVLMHQLIMRKIHGDYDKLLPDHINRDPLDNRRENLRLVTPYQNAQNRRRSRSKYVGVYQGKSSFTAFIRAEGLQIHIGSFPTAKDAAYVRDQFAMELHGQHAVLNFEY